MRYVVLLISLLSSILIGEIYDFVPSDFDLVLVIKNVEGNYTRFKNLPLGSFIFGGEGVGMEYIALEILDDVEKDSGISKNVFLDSISKEIMICAKGMTLDFNSLTSLDLNYYIDILRNLGSNTLLVMRSASPDELMEFISDLLGLNLEREEGYYVLRDDVVAIYSKTQDGYILMSGGKASIESAIVAYTHGENFIKAHPDSKKVLDEDAFVVGYFRGDSFKIDMGINVEKSSPDMETEKFELVGRVLKDKISILVKQYVKGDLEKPKEYLTSSGDMGNLPKLGNYYFGASAKGSKAVLDAIMSWFSGKSEELDRMAEVVGTILEHSKGKVYIAGDIVEASTVTFAVIFDLDGGMEDITSVLEKNGARVYDSSWRMEIGNTQIYFFNAGGRFVMTNLEKEKYVKLLGREKLKEDPTYSYFVLKLPEKDMSRGFVDVGDILEKLVGIKVSSKMIFFQTYKDGIFLYDLEVM